MKIAAFDIAVKSLSVCIMDTPEYNESNELIYKKPTFWEFFNILDDYPICAELNCGLPGKWKNEYNKNFCGRHKRRGKVFKDPTEIIIRKVKEYTPFEIQTRLIQTLDKHPQIYNVDYMFIENQDQKNAFMCNIASSLFTYYVKKAYIDPVNPRLREVNYIRATRKTKNVPIIGEPFESTKKDNYGKRKETSIVYCQRNCKKYSPELLDFFNSHRKKDDMADSYQTALAGIWVLHFKQIYPKITPEIVQKYAKMYGISEINPKGRKRTFKQYIAEFESRYIWIEF
jgi:hypothetical protein